MLERPARGPEGGPFAMHDHNARKHQPLRSVATFIVVLVVGSFFSHELFSHFSAKRGPGPGAGIPEKVLFDRVTVKRGQVMRYDVVLRVSARVQIDIRSSRVPVSVKLVAGEPSVAGERRS